MTENVAAVRTVPVPLSAAHLSAAVWGDVLVKLRVLQLTCSKSPSAAHQKHSNVRLKFYVPHHTKQVILETFFPTDPLSRTVRN